MRYAVTTTGFLSAAALAAATLAWAGEPSLTTTIDPVRMIAPMTTPMTASESGVLPPELRLRAIVARALDDSIATWKRLAAANALEVGTVNVRFVTHLAPANCFGLYSGDGPAYCSGNATVFVGVDAANHLMARFGPAGEAGITFLIGHEIGHHIQNIFGRFALLNYVVASAPASRVEFLRRFELEADCYAGVWMQASDAWAKSDRFHADMRAVIGSIGDDNMSGGAGQPGAATGVHGSSQQRVRWFEHGLETGNLQACDTFAAPNL
jgi:predicted metalloprotease